MILCTDTVLLNYIRVNNDPDNFYNMKKLSAESEEYSETEKLPAGYFTTATNILHLLWCGIYVLAGSQSKFG